jgi:flagellar hook-associated protein 3 FlgL
MEMRVATFAQSDQMITSALRTQSIMANEQIEESSGVKSEDFAGYGSDTQSIINLQISVSRAETYIDAATQADSKVQVMYSAVGSVTDLITNLRSDLSAATTGSSSDTSSLISSAQDMLQEMGSILNTQYDGQYVFSGASTSTAPVDLTSFDSGTGSLSTADTSYYQGDDQIASVQVSDDQTVNYGVTADNSAFEQVMRVLKYIANSSSLSSSDISSAASVASNALDAVSIVQSKLSDASSQIEEASSEQTSYKNYASTFGSDLTSVDVAAVTAQMSTYQSQLTASYAAIAKIDSMNLASYLK